MDISLLLNLASSFSDSELLSLIKNENLNTYAEVMTRSFEGISKTMELLEKAAEQKMQADNIGQTSSEPSNASTNFIFKREDDFGICPNCEKKNSLQDHKYVTDTTTQIKPAKDGSGVDTLYIRKKSNMKATFISFLFVLCIACKNNSRKKIVTVNKDGLTVKGYIVNDSIFDDTVYYYDAREQLVRKEYFQSGKLEGHSIEFYANGKMRSLFSYTSSIRNGVNGYYDSSGRIVYRDFYYYGVPVGPITLFDEKESPKRFFFINFQNETLMDIDYRNWLGVSTIYGNCINYTYGMQRRDTTREVSLFLYLINPPKFKFEYSIFKKKSRSEKDFRKVKDISSDYPFIDLALPMLPLDEQYVIGLNIYDSILKKETVIYKDVW